MSEEALTPQENEPESASDARLRLLQAINAFVAASKPITAGVLTNEVLTRQMAVSAEQIQKAKAALNRFAVLGYAAKAATAGLTPAEILAAKMNQPRPSFQKAQEAAEAFAETLRWVNDLPVSVELMKTVEEGVVTFGELARDLEDGE